MLIAPNTSREDLEFAILSDNDLYAQFDEQRLLKGEYTIEQLFEITSKWIEACDECAACA